MFKTAAHPRSEISRIGAWDLFVIWILGFGISATTAAAQPPRTVGPWYQPLDQRTPPGVAAYWTAFQGKATPGWFQPVRFELPTGGNVTLFNASPDQPFELAAPARAGLLVGHLYRLKIADMPEFPGIELYPTIEVLDRLHPPPGREADFPVPVPFTRDEIERALTGGLVTKVVYVEQPQLASARDAVGVMLPVETVPSHLNLLSVADQRGRPLLIVRLGGRIPDVRTPDPTFWGTGAPVQVNLPAPE
jgi:hypothetical protein